MSRAIIVYELHAASKDKYTKVEEAIEKCSTDSVKCLNTTWVIESNLSHEEIGNTIYNLAGFTEQDRLIVGEFTPGSMLYGLDDVIEDIRDMS